MESLTIKHMIEENCADNSTPLPNVTSRILGKVIEYCKKLVEAGVDEDNLKASDAEFVKVDDNSTLFDIILAADFLNINSLLDPTCQAVVDMLKGKIKNDHTTEQEEEIRS